MTTVRTGEPFLWRPNKKAIDSLEEPNRRGISRRTLDVTNRPIVFDHSPSLRNGVAQTRGSLGENGQRHTTDLHAAVTLYEQATGEAPQEAMQLEGAVLIETGMPGDYERFPNGYVPILICHTSDGWLVCDTGQTLLPPGTKLEGVQREGDVLYVRTGPAPDDVHQGVRTMLNVLRTLN